MAETPAPPAAASLLDAGFVARLERLEIRVRRLIAGERRGDAPMNRRGPGALFRGHRGYVAGDDPRFVDWNALLRLGELVVKEFDAEESARLTLFVDVSASMTAAGGRKYALALELAAALGFVALARHVPLAVAPLPGPGGAAHFSGRGQTSRLLAKLASFTPQPKTAYLRAFQAAAPAGRAPGVALVLSDFYDLEEYGPGLAFLRKRGYQTEALHLFADAELRPTCEGPVEFRDLETGRRLRAVVRPELREAYRALVERHFGEVAARCRAEGAGYHRLSVDEPLETTVLSVLRARGVVR
jgi:uncharacterized protein (DUF58 family)